MVSEVTFGAQFVETLCGECVLRIDADAEDHFVEVRLIMAHPPAGGWRYRLREAWEVWRGRGREWFDFYTRRELEAFVAALERAKPVLIYNAEPESMRKVELEGTK